MNNSHSHEYLNKITEEIKSYFEKVNSPEFLQIKENKNKIEEEFKENKIENPTFMKILEDSQILLKKYDGLHENIKTEFLKKMKETKDQFTKAISILNNDELY